MAVQDTARVRWALDSGAWQPSDQQWQECCAMLPETEVAEVLRFVRVDDRHRAMCSRLMQRAFLSRVFGMHVRDVQIRRTKGRKPYHAGPANPPWAPNLNYNVSHEGRFTVLVSEAHVLVGVDVAAPTPRPVPPGHTLLSSLEQRFRDVLDTQEWECVRAAQPGDARVAHVFQTFWSLKEAFIKARGDGLGFSPLKRACFTLCGDGPGLMTARLTLDGVRQDRWRFAVHPLPHGHVMSVARGPPADAMDALGEFRATFQSPNLGAQTLAMHLDTSSPPVELISIDSLLDSMKETV